MSIGHPSLNTQSAHLPPGNGVLRVYKQVIYTSRMTGGEGNKEHPHSQAVLGRTHEKTGNADALQAVCEPGRCGLNDNNNNITFFTLGKRTHLEGSLFTIE